jgi:hypothetical protein
MNRVILRVVQLTFGFVWCSMAVACATDTISTLEHGSGRRIAPGDIHADYSYRDGNLLVAYDEYGNSFTLDAVAQKIRYSDGRVVLLDAEGTANMANAFLAMIDGDATAIGVDGMCSPESNDCTFDSMRDPEPLTKPTGLKRRLVPTSATAFPQDRSAAPSTDESHSAKLIEKHRVTPTKDSRLGIRVLSVKRVNNVTHQPVNDMASGAIRFANTGWPPNCQSAAYEMRYAASDFRAHRRGILGTLLSWAMNLFSFSETGEPQLELGNYPEMAHSAYDVAGDLPFGSGMQLAVMRSLYQGIGCPPIAYPQAAAGGGPFDLGPMHADCSQSLYERYMNGQLWQIAMEQCLLLPSHM